MTTNPTLQRTLGERLVKIRRISGGLTQQEVADRLGTGKRTLVRYENDEVTPDLDTLKRIARMAPCTVALSV